MHYKGWYSVDGSDDTVFGESKREDGTGKPLQFTMGKVRHDTPVFVFWWLVVDLIVCDLEH